MKLKTKVVCIKNINPAPYNPRVDLKPDDPRYKSMEHSLGEFGYVESLVWNEKTQTLVAGHQRFKIIVAGGATEIEVSVVHLTLEKEKQLNLILNKVRGDWDEEKLAGLLDEFSRTPDFDLADTGFDRFEVSEILDRQHNARNGDDFNFDAAVDSIVEPITKKGDLIKLGNHRILCGDSANAEDMKRLFEDKKANLIHMDPPYGCSYSAENRPNPKSKSKKNSSAGKKSKRTT